MVEWIKQYAVPLIGGLVGLVFAILFLSIGFFKTLLVVLLTGLGIWLWKMQMYRLLKVS